MSRALERKKHRQADRQTVRQTEKGGIALLPIGCNTKKWWKAKSHGFQLGISRKEGNIVYHKAPNWG